jgi:aminopeptidase N
MCHDDATWLDLMAAYRDSFEYSNASTDDLNRIMNQTLAGDYDWFFQEWVYDMGYPVYQVQWNKIFESPNWRLVLDVDQVQTIGPAVFHMPLPIGINYPAGDTIVTLAVDSSYEHYECLLPQEPISIVIDPETWVIQKNTVTAIDESHIAALPAMIEQVQTIGRAMRIHADRPTLIEIFDISGRKVYQKHCQDLCFKPRTAGIYHAVIEGKSYRFVIVD